MTDYHMTLEMTRSNLLINDAQATTRSLDLLFAHMAKGDRGNGITRIELTSTVGEVKTYTIYFDDGFTKTYTVTDGHTPIFTADADGTIRVDGAVLTTVVKTASEYATAKGDYANSKGDYALEKGNYANDKGDYANAKGDYALEKGNLANEKATLANTKAQLADEKATLADQKATLANAAADRANDLSDHPMYINTDNYHWMKWNEDSEAYVDTGIMASCSPYATFEINMLNGQLIMETDSYYAGPTFSLNNGNLVFTI